MIWNILKKSVLDIYEEMLYLVILNFVWLVGALLVLPLPLVTFGLFFTVYDISQGKGIKFQTFLTHMRQTWKPAYIWGAINLGILVTLWLNLAFYAGIEAQWAVIVQTVMIALATFWAILQLLALALYPRLTRPGFKLALRNAAAIVGLRPLAVFGLVVIVIVIGLVSLFFQVLLLVGLVSMIAVVANRTVQAVLEKALDQPGLPGKEDDRTWPGSSAG